MSGVAVVTDSTAALSKELAEANGVHVVPLYTYFGRQALRDGVDLTLSEFYLRLRAASVTPTTSQPAAGDFLTLYRRLSQECDGIVSIHISGELSGTIESARSARRMLHDEMQTHKDPLVPIHIIDSRTVSIGLGLVVLQAARAALAGKSVAEVAQIADELIPRINLIFTVETLEYLRRGGRIGGAAALLGTVLDVKPILHISNGRIDVLEKVRTKKRALARMTEIMAERLAQSQRMHVAVVHTDACDDANRLANDVFALFNCDERLVADAGSCIGVHTGPGVLGLGFYTEGRAQEGDGATHAG